MGRKETASISGNAGIPAELQGCHTSFLGGYVVDGHVPIETVQKLLTERPAIKGLPGWYAAGIAYPALLRPRQRSSPARAETPPGAGEKGAAPRAQRVERGPIPAARVCGLRGASITSGRRGRRPYDGF